MKPLPRRSLYLFWELVMAPAHSLTYFKLLLSRRGYANSKSLEVDKGVLRSHSKLRVTLLSWVGEGPPEPHLWVGIPPPVEPGAQFQIFKGGLQLAAGSLLGLATSAYFLVPTGVWGGNFHFEKNRPVARIFRSVGHSLKGGRPEGHIISQG